MIKSSWFTSPVVCIRSLGLELRYVGVAVPRDFHAVTFPGFNCLSKLFCGYFTWHYFQTWLVQKAMLYKKGPFSQESSEKWSIDNILREKRLEGGRNPSMISISFKFDLKGCINKIKWFPFHVPRKIVQIHFLSKN